MHELYFAHEDNVQQRPMQGHYIQLTGVAVNASCKVEM